METLLALGKCSLQAARLLKPWKEGFALLHTRQGCSELLVMRQDDETPHCNGSASPSGLLHTGCPKELSRSPFSCCLSAGCVQQHHPGLQHAPGLLLSQPDLGFPCPLLSSLVCCSGTGLCSLAVASHRRSRSLCLSPERRSIPFLKTESLPVM